MPRGIFCNRGVYLEGVRFFRHQGTLLGTKGCSCSTEGCFSDPKSVFRQLGVGSLPAGALDDSEGVHMRILQTIYQQLTCSRLGCPRYGAHWEELGFQGRRGHSPLSGEIPRPIPKIHADLPWSSSVLSQLPEPLPVLQTSSTGLPWTCSST